MHILLYERDAYTQEDLTKALLEKGFQISTFTHTFVNKNKDDDFCTMFDNRLRTTACDAVFSINYYPLIAQVCYEHTIPYLSWSYDNPLDVRNIEDTLGYPTNYVFLFDKLQVQFYHNMGFEQIYHLPLAANVQRLDKIIPSSNERNKYGCDISFVGSLYPSVLTELAKPLDEYTRGYLDALCECQLQLYGCFMLNELITPELLDQINRTYYALYPESGFQVIKEELSYTMATHITCLERIRLLQALSANYKTNLFSATFSELLPQVHHHGIVSYQSEMPKVFKSSKINLNITLKCLQSGIPLRALDIMACEGFLLSNYQPELVEYFIEGTDFVAYTSMEDAVEKAGYYLQHDTERKSIARNGYLKVKANFGYQKQLDELFKIAGLS